jgi:hypothetical protein
MDPFRNHPCQKLFSEVAAGRFPAWDGMTEPIAAPQGARAAVLAFAGHNVVAADVDPEWVRQTCLPADLVSAVRASFLDELGRRISGLQGPVDLVLMAGSLSGPPGLELEQLHGNHSHPRMQRAHRVRRDVRIFQTPTGEAMVAIGRGLGGRWEAGFEVEPPRRGHGIGRLLAGATRHLIPAGDAIFLQVAAGNAASLRAVLAAGFRPIGAEVLFNAGENLPEL